MQNGSIERHVLLLLRQIACPAWKSRQHWPGTVDPGCSCHNRPPHHHCPSNRSCRTWRRWSSTGRRRTIRCRCQRQVSWQCPWYVSQHRHLNFNHSLCSCQRTHQLQIESHCSWWPLTPPTSMRRASIDPRRWTCQPRRRPPCSCCRWWRRGWRRRRRWRHLKVKR